MQRSNLIPDFCGFPQGFGGGATNKKNEAKGPKPEGSFLKIASELLPCKAKTHINSSTQKSTKERNPMQLKNQKHSTTIKTVPALLTAILLTSCSSLKARDQRLVENLEKQNAVIDAAQADREAPEIKAEIEKSEALKEAEVRLVKALGAVKSSNETVISKIKPDTKKECSDGEDEGDRDE